MTIDKIVEDYLPTEKETDELAEFFGIFADKTRLKILTLLSLGDLCVSDICYVLYLNQSTVSHQLRNLKDKRLVNCYKNGKRTVYYISNSKIDELLFQAVLATEIK